MSERQKLELSFSGLAAGALATITATVLASFFGSYGTLIGAGASSVVSTAGAAIYQHFFRRTGSKLKEASQHLNAPGLRSTHIFERGGTVTTADPRQPGERRSEEPVKPEVPAQPARSTRPRTLADVMDETRAQTTARIGDQTSAGEPEPAEATSAEARGPETAKASLGAFAERSEGDRTDRAGAFGEVSETTGGGDTGGERADGTRVMDAAAEPTGPGDTDDTDDATSAAGESNLADSDDAETMAINRMGGVSEVYTSSGVPPKQPTAGVMLAWARGRWPKLLAGAVGVFIVVMGVVTGLEAIMDKPLSAAVRGEKAHGLTLTGGNAGAPATNAPTNGPSVSGSPNPTERPTEQNPGNTAPSTPNPGQTEQQNPGQQTKVPQQPTTQPTTVPTQPQSTPDQERLGPGQSNDTQGQNQSPTGQ